MMRYGQVSLYAMLLAAAGLPLYIHLPRFATTQLGLSLSLVSTLLVLIRIMDFVQDPFFGYLIDRKPNARALFVTIATLGMATGFVMLFSLSENGASFLWVFSSLVLVFSAYSLGSILFYGLTTTLAESNLDKDIYKLAGYREGGMLFGVITAALAPLALANMGFAGNGYPAFGWFLAMLAVLALVLTRSLWTRPHVPGETLNWQAFRSSGAARLVFLALINSLPVAITSTLFLFFVEDRLQLPDMSGVLLILFFACAGLSVPLWTRLAQRYGARKVLIPAMLLAIASFIGAAFLQKGDATGFALICIGSGAALGADMVILPALFASTLEKAGLRAGQAFGIWSFATKLALALAAIALLPLLDIIGFRPGQTNSEQALNVLSYSYALVPCGLKLLAIALTYTLPEEETRP